MSDDGCETPIDTTSDVHSDISPVDLPKDHPGRKEAEHLAEEDPEGRTRGNVPSPLSERARRALGAEDEADEDEED